MTPPHTLRWWEIPARPTPPTTMSGVQKVSAWVPVTEEMLVDLGMVEPSPEYLAREAELDRWRRTPRGRLAVLRIRLRMWLDNQRDRDQR